MAQTILSGLQKWWPVLLILLILVVAVIMLFQRWNISQLVSHPNPSTSYEESVQRIEAMRASEGNMNPVCQTQFLTHGQQTEKVIILVHGYTNCPQQFAELGKRFYDLGYNVLIAPLPHHGLADRMTDEQSLIRAEEFPVYADKVVDIAQGLGKHVIISGLSLGGAISAWAAQNRSDVDLAVIMSPGFSFEDIPLGFTYPIANIFMMLPVTYEWWDDKLKENNTPSYAYPRYTRHALGEILRFGYGIQAQAEQSAPRAKAMLIVTNANDKSVDNDVTAQVIKTWRAHGANLSTYEFPEALRLDHDMIDPSNPKARIDLVYPKLLELVEQY